MLFIANYKHLTFNYYYYLTFNFGHLQIWFGNINVKQHFGQLLRHAITAVKCERKI